MLQELSMRYRKRKQVMRIGLLLKKYIWKIQRLHNERSAGSGKKRCFFLIYGGIPMLYPMSITQLFPMGSPVYIF